ncbi:MAG: DivIVA domain-containing protein [Syntrophobacter sp.]
MDITELEQKKFRTRLMGFDPHEVESFFQEVVEELSRLKTENENLKRDLQAQELEIRGHKDREKTIRSVLVSAQKNAEQTRANAEREARLIVSEAEVNAEKILKDASDRILRMEREIGELKRHRIQFGARMRALLDTYRQILDEDSAEKLVEAPAEKAAQPQAAEPDVPDVKNP